MPRRRPGMGVNVRLPEQVLKSIGLTAFVLESPPPG
jgi:hypothetical protein